MRGSIFRLAHELRYPGFTDHYRMLLENQWKSHAQLREEQDASLRAAVRNAYETVPYYHSLFRSLSLSPDDIRTGKDLERLPVLTKDVIKRNWERFKPSGLAKMRPVQKATGGSTGTPFEYRTTKDDIMMGMCHQIRGWSYLGYELGDRMVMMGGSSLTLGIRSAYARRVHELVRNVRMLSSFDMGEAEMRRYASVIASFRPRYVFGYASSLAFFSRWASEAGVELHRPRAVFTTAEKLFPEARAAIGRAFGCGVHDSYGVNDSGVSAIECGENTGFHINTERALMEVVDGDGNQVTEGEGRILGTSLHNPAMPFLRYDTGDLATILGEDCPCGRGYRLLKEIQGREQEMLTTPEGKNVHGEFFTHIFWEVKGVREFQVVQDRADHLRVRIVTEEGFDASELDKVRAYIASRSRGWVVDFEEVDAIGRAGSGKFRFIVREVRP